MTKGYLGIDIGSISTKGVIIDENRAIIARSYLWTEGNPTEASKNVVRELERQVEGAGVDIVGAGTTGSARRLVGAMLGASVIKNEITAHAVGTTHLHPDVRTILEIGGQDSKIICVSDGIAVDYAMNTLCAAGTGSFLSSQAHRLGVEVEEFGDIALTSTKPANIAARCTVFAESDLVHKIQVGYAREDIIAGLVQRGGVELPEQRGQGQEDRRARGVPGRRVEERRGGARLRGAAGDARGGGSGRAPHGRFRRGAACRRCGADCGGRVGPVRRAAPSTSRRCSTSTSRPARSNARSAPTTARSSASTATRTSSTLGATAATRAP